MKAMPAHRISVTALADFSCRTGDLNPAGNAAPTAREGILAHQKMQRAAVLDSENQATSIESEVSLVCTITTAQGDVRLRGRVDLLDRTRHCLTEIKTTLVPAEQVPDSQQSLQWAQLYLYGFIYLCAEESAAGLEQLQLELVHVNIRADTQEYQRRTLSRVELEQYARSALETYLQWLERVSLWQQKLMASARDMSFPFGDFRAGQRDMAVAIYRAARDAQPLMCEAPTGIGKTLSALFPAIKSLGEGQVSQIAYLTAKVAGRLSALQALSHMQSSGLAVTAVQIRAKQATCFCSNGRCERDESGRCPMTLDFFDRLPAARDELLDCGIISDAQLDDIAWEHQLCPFELALQLLPWVHVVIADYNYVFDPLVKLPHFSDSCSKTLLLIDEAHNLVDRSRSMFSAQLSRSDCLEQASLCRQFHPLVAHALDNLARQLLAHAAGQVDELQIVDSMSGVLGRSAGVVIEAMVASFSQAPSLPDSSGELFRTLCRFVVISDLFGEHHRCITSINKAGRRKEVLVKLFCLDASTALLRQYRLFRASIVFSATLRPAAFYRDALGMPETTGLLELTSPFPPERANHAIVDWIDTRYRKRTESLDALVELIYRTSDIRHGNYLVFFPSYAYLQQAWEAYRSKYPEREVWRQSSDQSRVQQHELLEHLEQPGHRVGFAILGGVFGEGIDYIGERLIGVIVVSPGLPGLDAQTQLVASHYQQQGHDGFDFAYRYPGFTRVLQTVGRLVRSETDSGTVILVDDRFKQRFYRALFPQHWQVQLPRDQAKLLEQTEQFWDTLEHDTDSPEA
ncbi:ATP-dependent DNA helicase [Granulosicoccus antarcticus]|uniref:Helicase ATP-binding domain-containing protein n=1 Tax=Granulosicoccus antarcticus IMCC3135 TaxID=1192854 RepID=A0A2Z2NY77_9GAMM|nr:ATP-dependent DNA helicase [Granulosicoccus antarcticus]ASJ75435.1 hypothetical protein IMCC3135_26900 [Granulosicoccus antarcticus IMCC3135]